MRPDSASRHSPLPLGSQLVRDATLYPPLDGAVPGLGDEIVPRQVDPLHLKPAAGLT
jgi:hypothetical protein